MDPKMLLNIMAETEKLKNVTRHCYTSGGRHESVAEHSWMAAMMALLMRDEFVQADMDKVIKMCLIHDMGEAFTGDVPSFNKNEQHEVQESLLLNAWVTSLPEPYRTEFKGLYAEMDALQTFEAKIYKAIDNMEAVIQHNLSDISTWIPLEYELNLTYGNDKVAFSDYLNALRKEIRKITEDKIENSKN